MDIDKILLKICEHLGKEKTYKGTLKRAYNTIDKDHTAGGLKELIPDTDAYEQINLLKLLKKYEIAPDLLGNFIEPEEEEPEIEELEEDFDIEDLEESDLIITDDIDFGADEVMIAKPIKKTKVWESLFDTVEETSYDPDEEYEKLPSLRLLKNAKYYLKLVNPNETARPVNTSNYGKDQVNYITKVTLIKVSPSELYETTYSTGDYRGQECFVNGQVYNLWLEEERMFKPFVRFWRDTLGLRQPDSRIFTIMKTQKLSKNNRYYNVFKFDSPKKRK